MILTRIERFWSGSHPIAIPQPFSGSGESSMACPRLDRVVNRLRKGLGLTMAVLLGLSSSEPAADAHDPVPVVDISRWFGPIDPRLDDCGGRIAFSYQGAIWRTPRAGGVMTRLTDGPGFDVSPAWSPDGKRIAFINSGDFAAGPLRLIRADDGSTVAMPRSVIARGKLEFEPSGAHPGSISGVRQGFGGSGLAQPGDGEARPALDRIAPVPPLLALSRRSIDRAGFDAGHGRSTERKRRPRGRHLDGPDPGRDAPEGRSLRRPHSSSMLERRGSLPGRGDGVGRRA